MNKKIIFCLLQCLFVGVSLADEDVRANKSQDEMALNSVLTPEDSRRKNNDKAAYDGLLSLALACNIMYISRGAYQLFQYLNNSKEIRTYLYIPDNRVFRALYKATNLGDYDRFNSLIFETFFMVFQAAIILDTYEQNDQELPDDLYKAWKLSALVAGGIYATRLTNGVTRGLSRAAVDTRKWLFPTAEEKIAEQIKTQNRRYLLATVTAREEFNRCVLNHSAGTALADGVPVICKEVRDIYFSLSDKKL